MKKDISQVNTKSYTYRYLRPENTVYLINKRLRHEPLYLRKSIIYSNKYDDNNAIVAYLNEDMCFNKLVELSKTEKDIFIDTVNLEDLEIHCNALKMPLTVVMNEYCGLDDKVEYTEVFLYKNKDEKTKLKNFG